MAGIYIHIPFCKQRCTYCDFHFSTSFAGYRTNMVEAMMQEIDRRAEYLSGEPLASIYFGGGTPSLLTPEELGNLLKKIHAVFRVNSNAEITLEANPDDITTLQVEQWKRSGINRLSIGIQSFREEDLQWMNRAHTAKEAEECVTLAQTAGITNLTVDLMYGLPGLTDQEWGQHIQRVIDMGVTHISAYCLTVEEKTALSKWVEQGKIVPASENQQATQFMLLTEMLVANGFEHYEISNFAKPGHRAVHNSAYWKGEHYLGIGPSAHSFNGTARSWNVRNNQSYIRHLSKKEQWFEEEQLSAMDVFNELLLTGLRTSDGVNLSRLNNVLTIPDEFWQVVAVNVSYGFMVQSDTHLYLTATGRLQADRIASDLFQINP